MTESTFWRIIESAKESAGGGADLESCEQQANAIVDLLADLPTEDVIAFDKLLWEKLEAAYRWDLWGAAYIMNGGCSDDGFLYWRAWLVAQGREVYTAALADPESLAEVPDDPCEAGECEDLLGAAGAALEKRGEEFPDELRTGGQAVEPAGRKWTEDEVDEMFPRLTARFG